MLCLNKLNKKKLILILAVILASLFVATPLYAEKLTDRLGQGGGSDEVVERIDKGGFKLVSVVRSIAIIGAVGFIVWAGIIFWGAGGSGQKIMEAKGKLIWFFVALILIFKAEEIFATIADFLGITF